MEVSWLCKEVPHLVTCKPLWRGPQSQAQPVSIAPQDIEMSGRGQFSPDSGPKDAKEQPKGRRKADRDRSAPVATPAEDREVSYDAGAWEQ